MGLYQNDGSSCFLFGEIKTSSDQSAPPNVMYGQTGLKRQLEDLCLDCDITLTLVKYLGFRLRNTQYWSAYQEAFCKYQANNSNVYIIGILVRNVCPNEKDLSTRAGSLCQCCIEGRAINLIAIYLPIDSITKFVSIVEKEHERRFSA